MKYMSIFSKKVLLYAVIALNLTFIFPAVSFASPFNGICTNGTINDGRGLAGKNALCSDSSSSDPIVGPDGIIAKITNIITIVAGVAAVINAHNSWLTICFGRR
jgi:hypothetical protein